jgi:hypothetical protein
MPIRTSGDNPLITLSLSARAGCAGMVTLLHNLLSIGIFR